MLHKYVLCKLILFFIIFIHCNRRTLSNMERIMTTHFVKFDWWLSRRKVKLLPSVRIYSSKMDTIFI